MRVFAAKWRSKGGHKRAAWASAGAFTIRREIAVATAIGLCSSP